MWRLRLSQGEQLLHSLEWGAAEGDTPHPRSAAAAVRRYPDSKVSSGSHEETPQSKVRSSRGIGKCDLGVQNEAGQRIIEFCEGKALVITNMIFQQHKRRLYT